MDPVVMHKLCGSKRRKRDKSERQLSHARAAKETGGANQVEEISKPLQLTGECRCTLCAQGCTVIAVLLFQQ